MYVPKTQTGVSLIELMISIVVLSIILLVGVPSFQNTLESSRARTVTNDLAGALQLARSEAIKRKANVTVCISDGASTPACGASNTDWSDGWLVVAADGTVVRAWQGVSDNLGSNVVQAPAAGITFTREGFIDGAASHVINIAVTDHERNIRVNPAGQVTVSIGAYP